MPLFDVRCEKCKYEEETILSSCPDNYRVRRGCDICGIKTVHTVLPALTNMQPDNMWSGTHTSIGYFTSKSEHNKILRERNIEALTPKEFSDLNKKVKKLKIEKRQKQLNNLNKHIQKELAGVEISPDGNTMKNKREFLQARRDNKNR